MSNGLKSPNRLIVNANAPVAQIIITIDNRYSPPEIGMQNTHPMPAVMVAGFLSDCLGNVLRMIVQAEAQALAGVKPEAAPEAVPDLPPAPALEN